MITDIRQNKIMGDPNTALAARIQSGDTGAYQELWNANKGLVAHFALCYWPLVEERNDIDMDDLTQAGYIGIHKAAEKYRADYGMKFSSYAAFYIKGEMRSTLGISRGKRNPIDFAISLDAPLKSDDMHGATLGDVLVSDTKFDWWEESGQWETIRAAVGRMPGNICGALIAYYWMDKSTKQIAADYGATSHTIWSRMRKGVDSLRKDTNLRKWAAANGYSA